MTAPPQSAPSRPERRRPRRLFKAALLFALAGAGGAAASPPVAQFSHFRYVGRQPVYDRVHAGPGQFLNPILEGFRSDPSIVRVGTTYYLTTSTFAYFPGPPVFSSRDLVHWRQESSGISRASQMDLSKADTSGGLYAADLKYHGGVFYLLNTCLGCGGNYVITAPSAAGPWSDPVWLDFPGIDPALFFDDDGAAWVVNNGPPEGAPRWPGHRAIWLQAFDLETLRLVGPRTVLVDGGSDPSKHPVWIEGPHIFRRGGYYYLICAEGGTGDQHSEVAFRATSAQGPYAPDPSNPILTQRDLDPARPDPISSTGHADFVQTPAGDWWAVFLGARPYRDDLYLTGRETFLAPVRWKDDWPMITEPGEVLPYVAERPRLIASGGATLSGNYGVSDDFRSVTLANPWTFLRAPTSKWWGAGAGRLTIEARPTALSDKGNPSFIALRQAHMNVAVGVDVAFAPAAEGDRAGLAAYQDERHFFFLDVERGPDGGRVIRLEKRSSANDPANGVVLATAPLGGSAREPVRLRLAIAGGNFRFSYRAGGGAWSSLGGAWDGAFLTPHVAHGFTGLMLGMFAGHSVP